MTILLPSRGMPLHLEWDTKEGAKDLRAGIRGMIEVAVMDMTTILGDLAGIMVDGISHMEEDHVSLIRTTEGKTVITEMNIGADLDLGPHVDEIVSFNIVVIKTYGYKFPFKVPNE